MIEVSTFYLIQIQNICEILIYLFPDKKSFLFWSNKDKFTSNKIIVEPATWELLKEQHPLYSIGTVKKMSWIDLLTYREPYRSFMKTFYTKFDRPLKFLKTFRRA